MRSITLLPAVLALISSVSAVDIQGSIKWNDLMKDASDLRPNTKVSLNHGQHEAFVRRDGSFVVLDVDEGEYTFEVISNSHGFDSLYLTVYNQDEIYVQPFHPLVANTPPARKSLTSSSTSQPSPTPFTLPYPLSLTPSVRLSDIVFEDLINPASGIISMLKSPMVLMLIFTGAMAIFAPKLLNGMEVDPEDEKRMREMREKWQGVGNTDWGEKLASKLAGSAEQPSAVAAPSSSGNNKRRKGR